MNDGWNEDPCMKVARALTWLNVVRVVPKFRLATGKYLVLAGNGGDVSVLLGLGFPPKNIHVVDRDPEALRLVSSRFPEVTVEQGELVDIARKSGRSFTGASLNFLRDDEEVHQLVQVLTQHALKDDGVLFLRLRADAAADVGRLAGRVSELNQLAESGTDDEVIEWARGATHVPGVGPNRAKNFESFLQCKSRSEAASFIREATLKGAFSVSRTVALGDLFLNKGPLKSQVYPRGFYFFGAPESYTVNTDTPPILLMVATVHRASTGETAEKFSRRIERQLLEYDTPEVEKMVIDEEVFWEKVLAAQDSMGNIQSVAKLFNISTRRIEAWKDKKHEPRDYEGEDLMQQGAVRVALFTKFPLGLIRGTIERKLRRHGVHLEKVLEPFSAGNVDLRSVDLVFDMFELGSHSEHEKVSRAAKKYGKPLLYLSRKEASWPDDFRNVSEQVRSELNEIAEAAMAAHKAVEDGQLESFLKDFMTLYESGKSHHDMIRPLGRYWRVGKLMNADQLRTYIRSVEKSDRCPTFFRQWREEREKSTAKELATLQTDFAREEGKRMTQNGAHHTAAVPSPPPSNPTSAESIDLAEELELYRGEYNAEKIARDRAETVAKGLSDEVSKYAERQASWEKRERGLIQDLERETNWRISLLEAAETNANYFDEQKASLTKEIDRLKASAPKTSFSSVRSSLTMLVEQGLLTEEEAIQKFWKFSPKE